jgi:hypothetical protein
MVTRKERERGREREKRGEEEEGGGEEGGGEEGGGEERERILALMGFFLLPL